MVRYRLRNGELIATARAVFGGAVVSAASMFGNPIPGGLGVSMLVAAGAGLILARLEKG
ncbi:MAG: hypothetical protein QXQ87_09710 [Halobacteria archaeon]